MRTNIVILVVMLALPLVLGFAIGYSVNKPAQFVSADSAQLPSVRTVSQPSKTEDVPKSRQQDIGGERRNAITMAVEKISPSVVGINVIEIEEQPGLLPNDPYFRRFFQSDPFFNQFFGRKQEVQGLGSGFIISSDGYIITNDHVAGNAVKITVTLVGGQRMDAQLVGTDPLTDISLLKVKGNNLPAVTLGNSDDLIVGEWSIAFGNPFGLFEINDKPTVTVGVISSLGMNLGQVGERVYRGMIETDAAINGGNSGGPLANSQGEVIGVNTLIFTGGQSSTFVGYGFAIPINRVKNILNELKKNKRVAHEYKTGFDVQKVDVRIARYFGMTKVEGVIVSEIERGSVAEKSGLKIGDIILTVNKDKINSEEELAAALSDTKSGAILEFGLLRDRKPMKLQYKFGGK
jgi:serine protease Do